ncbi:hypothetical protein EG68_01873 [Paragonimus skrjabini miyazakii]|uniref:Uncharacterized protein n=1 Tax=Paragonimus skrjabini miyazakii TaxID=59628 RepID=A0A8S9ZA92_9TREM|nr:hypothetical protein EG68_01873 [Paragonimus skrjabini miyazakii]
MFESPTELFAKLTRNLSETKHPKYHFKRGDLFQLIRWIDHECFYGYHNQLGRIISVPADHVEFLKEDKAKLLTPSNVVWSTEHYAASSPEQLDARCGDFFLALHWVNTAEIRCKRLSDGTVGNLPCDLLTGLLPALELRNKIFDRDSEHMSAPRLMDPLIMLNTEAWNRNISKHTVPTGTANRSPLRTPNNKMDKNSQNIFFANDDDVYHKRTAIHRSATDSKIHLGKGDQGQLPMVTVFIIPADCQNNELKTVNHERAMSHTNSSNHITIINEVKLRPRNVQGIRSNEA